MLKKEKNMIYFTSDLHLGHSNMIRKKNRPFQDVEEMNRLLIRNINSLCTRHDTLVIMGDLAYHQSVQKTEEQIAAINPKLVLIRGNHDGDYNSGMFEFVGDYKKIRLYNRDVVLSHYPFLEWDGYHRESVHLHGHQHNFQDYNERMRESGIRRYDVGVDANDYRPVSAKEIFDFFGLDTDDFGNSMKKIMW